MWRRRRPPADLRQLVEACEAGRDLNAILATACDALQAALGASGSAAYTLSEDGAWLDRVCGDGPDQLQATNGSAIEWEGRGVRVPLVSARRVLGCLTA